MTEAQVKNAVEKFEALIRAQSDRSDKIKAQGDFIDFKSLDKIIIGVCGGDGIGPVITICSTIKLRRARLNSRSSTD